VYRDNLSALQARRAAIARELTALTREQDELEAMLAPAPVARLRSRISIYTAIGSAVLATITAAILLIGADARAAPTTLEEVVDAMCECRDKACIDPLLATLTATMQRSLDPPKPVLPDLRELQLFERGLACASSLLAR
jgi:hypothetical protein